MLLLLVFVVNWVPIALGDTGNTIGARMQRMNFSSHKHHHSVVKFFFQVWDLAIKSIFSSFSNLEEEK